MAPSTQNSVSVVQKTRWYFTHRRQRPEPEGRDSPLLTYGVKSEIEVR